MSSTNPQLINSSRAKSTKTLRFRGISPKGIYRLRIELRGGCTRYIPKAHLDKDRSILPEGLDVCLPIIRENRKKAVMARGSESYHTRYTIPFLSRNICIPIVRAKDTIKPKRDNLLPGLPYFRNI